jgi:hypothetical protein
MSGDEIKPALPEKPKRKLGLGAAPFYFSTENLRSSD